MLTSHQPAICGNFVNWQDLFLILYNIIELNFASAIMKLFLHLPTFQSARMAPNPAGTNQIMFIIETLSTFVTISGVKSWPRRVPRGWLKRMVAILLCSSLNHCWLILVGTQLVKGIAIPLKAWPNKARKYFPFKEK